jgi:hypothetical protein
VEFHLLLFRGLQVELKSQVAHLDQEGQHNAVVLLRMYDLYIWRLVGSLPTRIFSLVVRMEQLKLPGQFDEIGVAKSESMQHTKLAPFPNM